MISALEAMQRQAESQQKHIERADESYKDLGTIKIFNVGPLPHVMSLGGLGMFAVQSCAPGRIYSEPKEIWKMTPEGKTLDMNKIEERLINGWGIAESIVGYGQQMHTSSDMRKIGIFTCAGWVTMKSADGVIGKVLASLEKPHLKTNPKSKVINIREASKAAIAAARKSGYVDLNGEAHGGSQPEDEIVRDIIAGDLPTEQEIDEATEHLHKYCSNLVNEANEYFRKNHLDEIQDIHRWAGTFTGQLELPWMKTTLIMTKCAICGNPLLPDVAICMGCDTIQPGKEAQIIAARVPKYEYLWNPAHPAYRAPVDLEPASVDPPAHGKSKGKQTT